MELRGSNKLNQALDTESVDGFVFSWGLLKVKIQHKERKIPIDVLRPATREQNSLTYLSSVS